MLRIAAGLAVLLALPLPAMAALPGPIGQPAPYALVIAPLNCLVAAGPPVARLNEGVYEFALSARDDTAGRGQAAPLGDAVMAVFDAASPGLLAPADDLAYWTDPAHSLFLARSGTASLAGTGGPDILLLKVPPSAVAGHPIVGVWAYDVIAGAHPTAAFYTAFRAGWPALAAPENPLPPMPVVLSPV
jgi:hypothetical protein